MSQTVTKAHVLAQCERLANTSYVPLLTVPILLFQPFREYLRDNAAPEYQALSERQAAPVKYWREFMASQYFPALMAGLEATAQLSPEPVITLEDAHARELSDVFSERARQLRKFGPQNRPPFEWFLILSEEVGEVAKECVEIQFDDAAHPHADPERYYKELTEVAAVALAAMQNFNQRRASQVCFHPEDEGGCNNCSRSI
ncbi:hypothetical protein Q5H92_26400 [Hymenobacter sp. M29]|uniref:Uncharacterized protein n=1 Tax=Hymenobacter mellowenesis TaxID=3063995 RepID=A0ABT9AJV6_9BACT|nr:hypothetical protein [Hymenobacter sp. M29]MDO7849918.1 hypothetical protein [Hymenobacter sp. M29]